MAEYPEYMDHYKVPVIAKLLHALPHYNITFHKINSTFRPNDDIYLESLGILGSVPAAMLIISLLGLLLYLMTRCCDRKPRPAHSITSLKVALSIVTVMCCAAIGLGLYGNDDLHNGLLEVLTAGRKVDTLVNTIRNQTHILENTLKNRIRPQLVELADIFDQPVSNQSALSILFVSLNIVQGNVTLATNAASDIRRPLISVTMTKFLTDGDKMELIRWPGTVATLALLLVLCAVLLVGVARHSRCALILFSVCGLLAVTGSWLMSGLYLSSSVAVGDLCINPADFLVSISPRDLPTNVLLHYTQCEPGHTNPFTQRLRESQNSLNNARSAMATVMKISLVLFKSSGLQPKLGAVNADLNSSERLLTQLTALVDCKAVHHNFLAASRGLCEGGLLGLVLMLIASFIAAVLLTIMVWVDSHTWIYIRKRNDYAQVDEPSYISHPAPQNHQQVLNASRTLPRNHNGHFSPPVISGSHTLQHPSKRHQHEMLSHAAQMQQNIRAMGTHTLGRLPSHNHSPTHIIGPNNACSDPNNRNQPMAVQQQPQEPHQQKQQQQQQQQLAPSQSSQQLPSQGIYCHYPHPHPHSHTAHSVHPAHGTPLQHQHQHVIYHQQQQYGTYAGSVHHQQSPSPMVGAQQSSIYQQIVPSPGAIVQNGGHVNNTHSIYQPLVAVSQGSIYVSNLATMRRPTMPQNPTNPQLTAHLQHTQQQQSHSQLQPLPQLHHHHQQPATVIPSQHPQQHQQQQQQQQQIKSPQDMRNGSRTESMETAIYERDKGIYKCSTLRQGGKFDPKYKPSILNCPLPEIPKDADPPIVESIYQKHHQNYSKTLQRPPMKLPPQMKAIPPPRVVASPPNGHHNHQHNHHVEQQAVSLGKLQQQQQSIHQFTNQNRTTTAGSAVVSATAISSPSLKVDGKHSITNGTNILPPPPSPIDIAAPSLLAQPKLLTNINNNNNANSNEHNINNKNNSNNNGNNNNNNTLLNNHSMQDDDELPPPPSPPALNDESNYAVTEL